MHSIHYFLSTKRRMLKSNINCCHKISNIFLKYIILSNSTELAVALCNRGFLRSSFCVARCLHLLINTILINACYEGQQLEGTGSAATWRPAPAFEPPFSVAQVAVAGHGAHVRGERTLAAHRGNTPHQCPACHGVSVRCEGCGNIIPMCRAWRVAIAGADELERAACRSET